MRWLSGKQVTTYSKIYFNFSILIVSVNQELQDCSSLHAGDWTDVRSVNHRYELYGKKMRLVSLEVSDLKKTNTWNTK